MPAHPVLHDADHQTADDIDQKNQDAGDRIAFHKLARAVHGTIKCRLFFEGLAPLLGLLLIDKTHIEIGVDTHLLTRHAIEREARRHFRDTLGATGDDDILHHDQNQENDQADDIISAHNVGPNRRDHPPRIRIGQDEPGSGYIERQPKQGSDQQQRRKGRKFGRT